MYLRLKKIEFMANPEFKQGEFVWTSDGGGSTVVGRIIEEPTVQPDPARQRLLRDTGVRALGGVPIHLDPEKIRKFLDIGK